MLCPFFPSISEEEILNRKYNYHGFMHVDIGHDDMDARDFIYLTDQMESDRRKAEEKAAQEKMKNRGKR